MNTGEDSADCNKEIESHDHIWDHIWSMCVVKMSSNPDEDLVYAELVPQQQ